MRRQTHGVALIFDLNCLFGMSFMSYNLPVRMEVPQGNIAGRRVEAAPDASQDHDQGGSMNGLDAEESPCIGKGSGVRQEVAF